MWRSLVARLLWEQDVAGSNPVIPTIFIFTELFNSFVCGCSSMVELQPSKLVTRVRFPSPAPEIFLQRLLPLFFYFYTKLLKSDFLKTFEV